MTADLHSRDRTAKGSSVWFAVTSCGAGRTVIDVQAEVHLFGSVGTDETERGVCGGHGVTSEGRVPRGSTLIVFHVIFVARTDLYEMRI